MKLMELKIKKETAQKIYAGAPDYFKEILLETFGKSCFEKREYTNIKTYEDACEILGLTPGDIFNNGDLPDEVAYKKLKVIIKAINNGWNPDRNDADQKKWYPWFNSSSGVGFSYANYDYAGTYSNVGSRLCFESKEKANYMATQFIDLYKEFLL